MAINTLKTKDDEIYVKKSDIDAIRKRPSMYAAAVGSAGALHICKEIIDNNRDECFKKDSPGNVINVEITEKGMISRDNGRGIPTKLLRVIHETNQAGSNMTRSGGATAGENGTGTALAVALSHDFKVTTIRPQEKKKLTLIYREGELIDEILEDYNGDDHGLITMFTPSKKILGVDKIPVDELVKWIQGFNYTLPKSINLNYTVNGRKYSVVHRNLYEFFDTVIPTEDRFCNTLVIECSNKLTETFMEKPFNRKFKIEAAIVYSNPTNFKGEDTRQSWMNMIYTSQNGSHVNGVINGLSKYLIEKAKSKNKRLNEVDNKDLKKDVLSHLHVVVKAECDFAHMFNSQAKHTVESSELEKCITETVYNTLKEMNQSVIDELVDVVVSNHRARIEGEKARAISRSTKTYKGWTKPKSFIPCSSIKTEQPKELFLVEGNSAGGGIRQARDPLYQAILMFRGKSLNVWDLELDRVLKSDTWMNLVKVLECGIGASFDIKKLAYDRIIIATDADVDGYHIRVIFLTFFYKFMPGIIESGKLWIVEPPLYELKAGKDVNYVASQKEYIEECINSMSDVWIEFPKKNGSKIPANTRDFVTEAFDYLETLEKCSVDLSVSKYLLEYIANGFATYGDSPEKFIDNVDDWLRMVTKVYPEVRFDHNTHQISATIDLIDQLIIVDEALVNSLSDIINIQRKYDILIHYNSKKRNIDVSTTLSKFFENIKRFYPVIKNRFKGLGSTEPDASKKVIMDPKTRRIFRVGFDDIHQTTKMLSNLIGKGKEDVINRKEMLLNFKFDMSMIDT